MKITWVNHASYIIEAGDIKLITDPWIQGRVFNESWSLLAESKFRIEDYKDITHIWFSHEHPDHFFPPNILKIPTEYRSRIKILFQETIDNKVIEFCRKNNFTNIQELRPYKKHYLNKDTYIINASVKNDTDSWLYFKHKEESFLNLNDCVIAEKKELKKIKSLIGVIDILFTQFSFANWVGNKGDNFAKNKAAENKKIEYLNYTNYFQPKTVIPFASYVWFCHVDNYHMNKNSNKIADIHKLTIDNGFNCNVLYPGDIWDTNKKYNSKASIEKYEIDYADLEKRNLKNIKGANFSELMLSAEKFQQNSFIKNNKKRISKFPQFTAYLYDLEVSISFSFQNGLQKIHIMEQSCDVRMSSCSLNYCFNFEWGFDTILIAGTYEKPENSNFQNFMEYQWIATLNNKGGRIGNRLEQGIKKLKEFIK